MARGAWAADVMRNIVVVGAVGLGLVAAGCSEESSSAAGSSSGQASDGDRLVIATTVAPITSLVSTIVGDRADVTGIVPEGTNSHTFEPKPSSIELLSDADVVYMNGLVLEEPTKKLAEKAGTAPSDIVELGTLALAERDYVYDFSFPEADGKPNPHLWTDPMYALRYAELIANHMAERDPDNASYYAANYEVFANNVDAFDAALRESFATIEHRKLLTYHDAYAYFAKRYDFEVIGAIQVSDFEDPTPAEVAELIDQVKAEQLPAIFGSEVFPSTVLATIGESTGATYVDELRDDDLPGAPGEAEHSWFGLMRFNFITMTDALGGDSDAIAAVTWTSTVPDTAFYPQ